MRFLGDHVEITREEDILGDFWSYLTDEKGFTKDQAKNYLLTLSRRARRIITPDFIRFFSYGEDTESVTHVTIVPVPPPPRWWEQPYFRLRNRDL